MIAEGGALWALPGVQYVDAGCGKVGAIAGDDGHAVYERGSGNQRISLGASIRYVQFGASLGNGGVDRQYPAGKFRQYVMREPSA